MSDNITPEQIAPEFLAEYIDGSGRYVVKRIGGLLYIDAAGELIVESLTRAPEFDADTATREEYQITERWAAGEVYNPNGNGCLGAVWIDGETYLVGPATEPRFPTVLDVEFAVALGKLQIAEDLGNVVRRDGETMPSAVADFSELHEWVDANEYGDLTADGPINWFDDGWNASQEVQNALDAWIKAGMPAE